MKKFLLLILMAFTAASCEIFEPNITTYFDVEGEGYAFNRETNLPIPFAKIDVSTHFTSRGWATKQPVSEIFIADSIGFFKVKFLKRIDKETPEGYAVSIGGYLGYPDSLSSITSNSYGLLFDEVKKSVGTIKIDTLTASFYYRNN